MSETSQEDARAGETTTPRAKRHRKYQPVEPGDQDDKYHLEPPSTCLETQSHCWRTQDRGNKMRNLPPPLLQPHSARASPGLSLAGNSVGTSEMKPTGQPLDPQQE